MQRVTMCALMLLGVMCVVPAFADEISLHDPEPYIDMKFPEEVSVGETFLVNFTHGWSYTHEWWLDTRDLFMSVDGKDIRKSPYILNITIPREFSIISGNFVLNATDSDEISEFPITSRNSVSNVIYPDGQAHDQKTYSTTIMSNPLQFYDGTIVMRMDEAMTHHGDLGFTTYWDTGYIILNEGGDARIFEAILAGHEMTPYSPRTNNGYDEDPIVTTVFPEEITVGETFVVDYTYHWPAEDLDRFVLVDSSEVSNYPYYLQIYMPDELSVVTENFVSYNVMADWYIPHVQKAHRIIIPSDITQVSHGSVEIRLDEEMTHDRDYIMFGDGNTAIHYHMFKKGDTVRLVQQEEVGLRTTGFSDFAFGRYSKFVHPTEEYVPSKRIISSSSEHALSPDANFDIPETKWGKFAEYLREIQLEVEPPSMREWLIEQGFSHTSVDSFLNEYPEFR